MDILGLIIEFALFYGIFIMLSRALRFAGKKTVKQRTKRWFLSFIGILFAYIILKIIMTNPLDELLGGWF